jgi:BioD-like phosphotransacetylase family protein
MPFPVLLTGADSYVAASTVHTLTVKTRPKDKEKISLIRDLIAKYVDVARIIDKL